MAVNELGFRLLVFRLEKIEIKSFHSDYTAYEIGWRKLNKSKLLGKYNYWANSCYVYADVPVNNAGVPK
jgi:hypothetical protein